jgi:hypothetical protein
VRAVRNTEPQKPTKLVTLDDRRGRVRYLRDALNACPADIVSRRELAALLEELGELEGAFLHWKVILDYDPNNLNAWEGVARCRERSVDRSKL